LTEIYTAGPRVKRVRFIMLLSLVSALAACWFGWDLFQTFGSRPADGGRLAPFAVRLAWGLGVAGLGVMFAIGMWVYGRQYVRTISVDPARSALQVRTLGMFGDETTSFPATNVKRSTFFGGRLNNPAGVSVNAPWFNVWIQGRRLPFILDAQGIFHDPPLLDRLLKA